MNGSGVRMVVSDNGSENISEKLVHEPLSGIGVLHMHTHVRCPQENSQVESANGVIKRQFNNEMIPWLTSRSMLNKSGYLVCNIEAFQRLLIALADDINLRPNFRGSGRCRLEHLAECSHMEENGPTIPRQLLDKNLRIFVQKTWEKDGVEIEKQLFTTSGGTGFVGEKVKCSYPADPTAIRNVLLHLDGTRTISLERNLNKDAAFIAQKQCVEAENRIARRNLQNAQVASARNAVSSRQSTADELGVEKHEVPTQAPTASSGTSEVPETQAIKIFDLSITLTQN